MGWDLVCTVCAARLATSEESIATARRVFFSAVGEPLALVSLTLTAMKKLEHCTLESCSNQGANERYCEQASEQR